MITNKEADILLHTSSNGRYVSNETLAIDLGIRGFMFDHGPQHLAADAHYLVLTTKGREAINEWRAAQPKPPKPKRRQRTPEFAAWRSFCDAFQRMPFGEFMKDVWPHQRTY